jgi:hypothetical protein
MTNTRSFATSTLTALFAGGDARVISKSYDLFSKRGVLGLAQSSLSPEEYEEWLVRALSLQLTIYGLDLYYEGRATLRSAEESPLWDRVAHELRRERHNRDDLLWAGFADLQSYADVETRIHQFDSIDLREFGSIVSLKCADVRMARGLIWTFSCAPEPRLLRYWEIYDQCWELIEDVLDIQEDGADWNFNFWLYSFMAGNDAMDGVVASSRALSLKLTELEEAYSRLPSGLSRTVVDSLHATSSAATLAQQCWRRVSTAISQGRVLRFGEQLWIEAKVA